MSAALGVLIGAVSLGVSCFALGVSWSRFRERELMNMKIEQCCRNDERLERAMGINFVTSSEELAGQHFKTTTEYADNVPVCRELHIWLNYRDWCEFERTPEFRVLVAYLSSVGTPDKKK